MKKIPISEFRLHLKKTLNAVKLGREIIITSHGRDIAKIVQPGNNISEAEKKLEKITGTAVINNIIDPVSSDWELK